MKKIKLATIGTIIALTTIVGGNTVSAATVGDRQTDAVVTFKPKGGGSVTPPVDPTDPSNPLTPVDPIDPSKPIDPGTTGPLTLDFASVFNFGEQEINTVDKVYTAKAQPGKDHTGADVEVPNYAQISDTRGTEAGWTLTVKQDTPFTSKKESKELTGAEIHFKNAIAKSVSSSATPSTVSSSVSIIGDGNSQLLMSAKVQEGAGTWIYSIGDDATKASSVELKVPAGANPVEDTYETKLTWVLEDVPNP
ncbi:WxL domain-containing protein [Carnobacterium gallinarum]|uniref:WxL domain-containing protein n=1 Tax=Carnobacterium gallinarum TaxID=2749 RepID=UPI00054F3B12|nr:WxL domain-containing protein [Carnobacterium gallinarum]